MSWSYRKEPALRQVPLPLAGGGWLADVIAYLAGLPLLGSIVALLALLVVAGAVLAGILLFVVLGPVPIPKELASASVRSTQVYAADGMLVANWHGAIDRHPVPLDQISKYLPAAVVAEEDARYYSNPGVDLRSVLRATVADLKAGKAVEGGSTITQQYVKVAYVGNKPSLGRKILEARIALQLSRQLSKSEIMNRYLNTVYFGKGAYGAEAAARTYFGKSASALTISEAAMLAGIIHSPDHDSPVQNPAAAETDRIRVIRRMELLGSITHAEADQARQVPPALVAPVPDNANLAWFLDALRTDLINRYGTQKVYEGGLQVHITVDPSMQAAAQSAVRAALPDAADPYASLVAIDPATGYVKAIVGGRDYSAEKFNIATMGRRQPGSAFKPFVLAAALEQGISPQAIYSGPSRLCLKGWTPGCVSNFGYESFGGISLLDATVHSVNTVYAQLILQVGPDKVAEVARRMGIPAPADLVPPQNNCRPVGSDICNTYLPDVPSLALGSAAVTPLEMASAYATLAAGGVYRAPKVVSEVTDASGKVLDSGPSAPVQAIPQAVAGEATQILQQVIVRGTGKAADIERPAAGKTGTAQDYRNAWFVGYTPTLATSVWVGYRDSNQPLVNVRGVRQVTGGTIPAHIWSGYMKVALDTQPPTATVTEGPPDGAVTNQTALAFRGTAADGDGDVTRVEASVDGAPFSTDTVTCTGCPGKSVSWSFRSPGLADGTHTFAFRSVDIAEHDSPAVTRTVTVDTVPPKPTGVQATGGSAALTVVFSKPLACSTLTPRDFTVSVQGRFGSLNAVSCDGTTARSVVLTLATAPRGGDQVAVTVGLRPADQAGNHVTDPRTVTVTATNVGPSLEVAGGTADGTLTSNAQPGYQGSATDPDGSVAGIEASIDGGPFGSAGISCSGCYPGAPVDHAVAFTYRAPSRLADGVHSIAFRAVDNAAADSPPFTRTLTVDTVPPKPTGLTAAGGAASVTITFSKPMVCSTLAPADFAVDEQGRSSAVVSVACTGPTSPTVGLTLAIPPRGGDQVVVGVASLSSGPTDQAGNPVGDPRTTSVTATNAGPSLEVTGGADGTLTSNSQPGYPGSATDADGSVAGIEASVDGGPFGTAGISCSGCYLGAPVGHAVAFTYRAPSRLADGAHSIAFRAVDNAAADSAPVTRSVTVDTVPPKPTGVTATGGAPLVTATFSKPLLCSTLAPADFSASLGGRRALVDSVACAGTMADSIGLTLDTPPRGGDQVVVTAGQAAADQAGNHLSAGRASTGTAANAAPHLDVTNGGPGAAFSSDARPGYQGAATDADGNVTRVEASVDGGPFGTGGVDCSGCSGGTGGGKDIAAPVSWAYHAPRLADGAHTVTLRSVDNGGATSPEVTQTVVVSSAPPDLRAVMASPSSTVVALIFSKPVACSSVDVGDFSVTAGGSPASLTLVTCTGASDAVVDLALTHAPGEGDPVDVTLTHPVSDDAGKRARAPVTVSARADAAASDLP